MASTFLNEYWAYRKEGGELGIKAWAELQRGQKRELDDSAKADGEPLQGKWFAPKREE